MTVVLGKFLVVVRAAVIKEGAVLAAGGFKMMRKKTLSFSKVYLAGSSLADITSKAESSFLANMTSGGASQSVIRQTFFSRNG